MAAAPTAAHGAASAALAGWVMGLRPEGLSAADHAQLQTILLDHCACGVRGAALPWGRRLQDWAGAYAKGGPAALYFGGGVRVPAFIAALANGAAAHGLELDDTHDESVSHPGAVVIAAALATAAEVEATGAETLAAIVVGYEVMARVGAAVGAGDMITRGFHPTAVFGAFGATATAGRLYGLSPEALQHAWGLALSMAGGSMQFSAERVGATVKRLHAGIGAQHGVLAAQLARGGVEGPLAALDGRYGAARLFGENPDLARLTAPADRLAIHDLSFKPYPCCRLFHAAIDALADVTDDFRLPAAAIAAIEVTGPIILVEQHMMTRPGSTMTAQYQLPFTLAAALTHGPFAEEGFEAEARGDPRLHALEDKVSATVDPAFQAAFPRHFGASVAVRLTDGTRRESRVRDSLGTPARPMSAAQLAAKADAMLAAAGAKASSADFIPLLAALPSGANVNALTERLSHG